MFPPLQKKLYALLRQDEACLSDTSWMVQLCLLAINSLFSNNGSIFSLSKSYFSENDKDDV